MNDVTKTLLEKYVNTLASQSTTPAVFEDQMRNSYRLAAAVLHAFVPEQLQPFDPEQQHPRPQIILFDDITRWVGRWADGLYTLKPEIRRQALRQLGSRERMLEALKANPEHPLTPLQEMWEEYLNTGTVPAPETLGYRQLTELHQLVFWMEGLDAKLPDAAYVLDLARRKSVLSNFEHLVISNFIGRAKELSRLGDHVGVLPSDPSVQYIARQFAHWAQQRSKPILSIYGPGGIGKSALIGRFLWEHVQAAPEARITFAYLAFDQPTLRIETPFTLLVDITAQFELQHPELSEEINRFKASVREYREMVGKLADRRELRATRGERIREVQELSNGLYKRFAELLRIIGVREDRRSKKVYSPILLVFDTFEEVQYRDLESLAGLWNMLRVIQKEYRLLRVIISGRAPIAHLGVQKKDVVEWQLPELILPDRVMLLSELGVDDPELAKAVAEQIGGNPLSLRLAADVLAVDPQAKSAKGIRDLTTTRLWLFQVDEQLIQGQLYQRILGQIHDENVRKLAHPGMVLRRVTPEIILEVLAPVCEISIRGLGEAQALFDELRREYGLVQGGEGNTLVYRPEIRRAMVRLLEQDRYSQVRALHRAAINYYMGQEGPEARAEEFYHRLVLDEADPDSYGRRWEKGMEGLLAADFEDYPDRAKVWLASRINIEVPREAFLSADTANWERNITRKVQKALSNLDTERALSLLHERPHRTNESPLYALEAKTYLLRNELEKASSLLEQGIQQVSQSTNRGRLAELLWLQSQVALLRRDAISADQILERAEQVLERSEAPIAYSQVLCQRLLLREKYPTAYSETAVQLRDRLSQICGRLSERNIYSAPFVTKLAVYVLQNEFPQTTSRLAKYIPSDFTITGDPLTSENLQGLESYREDWELDDGPSMQVAA